MCFDSGTHNVKVFILTWHMSQSLYTYTASQGQCLWLGTFNKVTECSPLCLWIKSGCLEKSVCNIITIDQLSQREFGDFYGKKYLKWYNNKDIEAGSGTIPSTRTDTDDKRPNTNLLNLVRTSIITLDSSQINVLV